MMSKYELVCTIAKAIFGDVVKCKRKNDGQMVAIKRISVQSALHQRALRDQMPVYENAAVEQKIFNETKVNPSRNVIGFVEKFEENGILHLVMEYCSTDLYEKMNALGVLNAPTVFRYFKMIASGLGHLHALGYAHLDLSLENILIDGTDECKICDFGLAANANVRTNKGVGKPFYMAPEVLQQKQYCPKSADMWSLGIMLLIMITGIPPFEVADSSDVRFAFVEQYGIRKLLESWNYLHKIPPQVMYVIERLLLLDPKLRAQCADLTPLF